MSGPYNPPPPIRLFPLSSNGRKKIWTVKEASGVTNTGHINIGWMTPAPELTLNRPQIKNNRPSKKPFQRRNNQSLSKVINQISKIQENQKPNTWTFGVGLGGRRTRRRR